MDPARHSSIAVIGGGPAGLMAAEVAVRAGARVAVYDHLASVGRKLLIAGKGGLNLTHSEPFDAFAARYRERSAEVRRWLLGFGPEALRLWAGDLGIATMVGSSGRVFPTDLKAAPLLRGWLRRLRAQGVQFHLHHRWHGWSGDGALAFQRTDATGPANVAVRTQACILALGGASWPRLGSDAAWVPLLQAAGVDIAPLQPSNCGFEVAWSGHFRRHQAGRPVKPVALSLDGGPPLQGEFVLTEHGIEGSLVYAVSAPLRERLARDGRCTIALDLLPGRSADALAQRLAAPRGKRSWSEFLRRQVGLEGARLALVHECLPREALGTPERLARALKTLPLTLTGTRPIEEAISSAGGVRLEALDERLMLRRLPGVFCAGEMLDWEAPTGGYLLTACLASGHHAALGALEWLRLQPMATRAAAS